MSQLEDPSKDPFDPAKGYSRVRFLGDRDLQDMELNEAQQLQDHARKAALDTLFARDAIIREAGGTIGPANQGQKIGNVTVASSGVYQGFATQVYTLTVTMGGGAGAAKIRVVSDGPDSGIEGAGFEIVIREDDPLDGSVLYNVGSQGVKVAFTDRKVAKNFVEADSWVILATHGRRLPVVEGNTITPFDVEIYVDGRILTVPSQTLTYPAASSGGASIVYVEVLRDIVTAVGDPSIAAALTKLPVAERERITAKFQDHDTSSYPLPANALQRRILPAYYWNRATDEVGRATSVPFSFSLADIPGQILGSALSGIDFSEELKGILAEAIQDIVGTSYRISGLKARLSTNTPATGKTLVTVEGGRARISGVRTFKLVDEDIELDLATDTAHVVAEGQTFQTNTNKYALNKAVGADKLPVKQVTALSATVQVQRPLTKGSANGQDELPDQPVSSIVLVTQGATVYQNSTDYLRSGNFIDWSPTGSEPVAGSQYSVTYRYTKQMVLGTDFNLIDNDSAGGGDSVDFSPSGDDPVVGTTFLVHYDYYLPRIDLVYLRTDGTFDVVRGDPADDPVAPSPPTQFLGIARVELGSNSSTNIKVINLDNLRVTMSAIRDAIRRQEILRLNDARQELLNQTKVRETASFKDVFADAFATDEQADMTFDRNGGTGGDSAGTKIKYDALIDLFLLQLTLSATVTTYALEADDTLLPSGQAASKFNRDFATLPFAEILEIDQDQWSEERNVNPFFAFSPPPPDVTLLPDRDIGINETTSNQTDIFIGFRGGRQLRRATQEEVALTVRHPRFRVTGRSVEEVARLIEDRNATFMRQIAMEVRGRRFVPNEDDISATFDGKRVSLTPIAGTSAGTQAGTVKARASTFDADGKLLTLGGDWAASFTIPQNVPSGVRSLIVTGASGSVASAPFTGRPTEREITIISREITTVRTVDPLAQTLAFSDPTTVVRLEVPLAKKGANADPPIEMQWRNVAFPGGFPGRLVFESIVRKAEDVNTGETSVNNFIFANPLFQAPGDFRALTLLTNSRNYLVYTATLGAAGQNPVAFVTQNLNVRGSEPAGLLLESLNALNWEPRSKSALRYRLYRADFSSESYLYFKRLSGVSYSQLFLNVDQVIPEGTSVTWQLSTDGLATSNPAKVWRNVVPFSLLDLGQMVTTVDVRAKLATSNSRISPYVNLKNWHLQGVLHKSAGKYIGRRSTPSTDITSVKIYVETNVLSAASVNFFVSNSEDSNGNPIWEAVTTTDASEDLGDGFTEKVLSKTLDNTITAKTDFKKARVRVDLSTTNQAIIPRIRNLAATFNG